MEGQLYMIQPVRTYPSGIPGRPMGAYLVAVCFIKCRFFSSVLVSFCVSTCTRPARMVSSALTDR